MKMAKASEKDMDVIGALAGILNDIDRGYFPRPPDPDAEPDENDPELFDPHDHEHLRTLYERLKICMDSAPGGLARVVMGFHVLMHNGLVDPEKDYLDYHPRIKAALGEEDDGTPPEG